MKKRIIIADAERTFRKELVCAIEKYIADESGIVNIPDNVETIAAGVFSWEDMPKDQFDDWESENDQIIEKIHIPANVKEICPGAFVYTSYLQDITIDPQCPAAEMIDGILFSRDKKRIIFAAPNIQTSPKYRFPATVRIIEEYAFMGQCFGDLVIPPSVEVIGEGAFAFCDFKSITIPDSIKHLGEGVFEGCDFDYDQVKISESNPVLKKDEFGLYAENRDVLINVFFREDKCFEIPSGVRAIESTAFVILDPKRIVIPEGVLVLKDRLFYGQVQLECIILPDSLIGIGKDVFVGCRNLKSIRISDNLEEIHENAFKRCENLEAIKLPDTLKVIGEGAFANCDKLVIHAPTGSYAIAYAKANGIAYKEI